MTASLLSHFRLGMISGPLQIHRFARNKAGVEQGGAGEEDDLQAVLAGAVKDALEGNGALGVGKGEGVVQNHRQGAAGGTAGENFGQGQAQGGGDLLFFPAGELGKGHFRVAGAVQARALEMFGFDIQAQLTAGAEKQFQVGARTVAQRLAEALLDVALPGAEFPVQGQQAQGLAALADFLCVGLVQAGFGEGQFRFRVLAAVMRQLGAGDGELFPVKLTTLLFGLELAVQAGDFSLGFRELEPGEFFLGLIRTGLQLRGGG